MDLYSKYVQIKIYGQVPYEEFPIFMKKVLTIFSENIPSCLFKIICIIQSEKNTTCAHTQTKQKGRITGMKIL